MVGVLEEMLTATAEQGRNRPLYPGSITRSCSTMSETEKEQQQYIYVNREPFEELLKVLHEACLALEGKDQS
jgi:hypothetical protein